ncbi:MAG: aminotransferase class III-fold pyridoxal phosphate-dependent enzyme [bacterium]
MATERNGLTRSFARHNPVGPDYRTVFLARAEGARLWAADGRMIVDLSCGAVSPLGHDSPFLREWIAGASLTSVPAGCEVPDRQELRAKLAEIVPGGANRRVRLCGSGREAMAAAVSLACRRTGRSRVAWVAELGDDEVGGIDDVAAVVVHPLDPRLGIAAERCRAAGAVLVSDETRLAPGLSGSLTGLQGSPVRADLTVFGQGLAAGMPFGAVVTGSSALRWPDADTGGTAAACRAALRYLAWLEGGLLDEAAAVAGRLNAALAELAGDVCCVGLVLAFTPRRPVAGLASICLDNGLLVGSAGDKMLVFEPPLVATADDVRLAVAALQAVLAKATR